MHTPHCGVWFVSAPSERFPFYFPSCKTRLALRADQSERRMGFNQSKEAVAEDATIAEELGSTKGDTPQPDSKIGSPAPLDTSKPVPAAIPQTSSRPAPHNARARAHRQK